MSPPLRSSGRLAIVSHTRLRSACPHDQANRDKANHANHDPARRSGSLDSAWPMAASDEPAMNAPWA